MRTKNVIVAGVMMCVLGLVAQAEVVKSIGPDADTYIDGTNANGSGVFMYVAGGSIDTAGYLRFDLGALNVRTVLDAQLILRNSGEAPRNDAANTGRFALYGLNNVAGNTPQNWSESTLSESGTNPVGAEWSGAVPLDLTGGRVTNLDADDGVAVTESIVQASGTDYWAPGAFTFTISGQALIDFLQARADDGGLATFIVANDDGNSRGYGIATKENATEEFRPILVLTYEAGGAMNPQPANGSTITDLDLPQLCWDNTNVYIANIWFGAVADVNEVNYKDRLSQIGTLVASGPETPIPNTCFPIPVDQLPLAVPETYYWVVETYTYQDDDPNHLEDPNKVLSESVWKFSTSAIPIAKTAPANQFKFPAESASFSVQFESLTPLIDATWYRDGSPVAVTPAVSDGGNLYTVTLDIPVVSLADDGTYYCIAANSGGSSEPSATADLVVKRRLAYWKFENTLTDEEGTYDGVMLDDPNLPTFDTGFTGAAGSLGQALLLDGTTDGVVLPAGFANFKSGLTFSVWANPSSAANWARFIDLGNGPDVDNIFLTRNGTSNTLTFNNNEGIVEITNTLSLNEWQMLVATMNEAGQVVLYKNGIPVQTGTVGIPAAITRTLNYIGESNYTADSFYAGLIDEVQVYNYALTEDEVADMYAGVYGDYCRYRAMVPNDFSGNCVIDLADLAVIASQWLDCGLYSCN